MKAHWAQRGAEAHCSCVDRLALLTMPAPTSHANSAPTIRIHHGELAFTRTNAASAIPRTVARTMVLRRGLWPTNHSTSPAGDLLVCISLSRRDICRDDATRVASPLPLTTVNLRARRQTGYSHSVAPQARYATIPATVDLVASMAMFRSGPGGCRRMTS